VTVAAPRVTVVIPNWNGRDLLKVVLPSLAAQEYRDFRTLVVDNGSEDQSVDYLHGSWPDVDVLELPENVGFAPAVNRGIQAATGDYIALLNNDVELEPAWLGELVDDLDRHPRAGSAASKLVDFHNRNLLDGAGDALLWTGVPIRRGHGDVDRGQFDAPKEVLSACGGAALYRRAALDDVGPFDEDFFAYLEDADWGLRARLRGWGCRYVPTSVAYHMGGATTRRQSDLELYLIARNHVALVLKNYPGRALLRRGWLPLSHQLWLFMTALRGGQGRRHLRAIRDAGRQMPRTLRKRRLVQRGRRQGVEALEPAIVGARRPKT